MSTKATAGLATTQTMKRVEAPGPIAIKRLGNVSASKRQSGASRTKLKLTVEDLE